MNRMTIGRIIAVLLGAAVLFGLEHGIGMKLYFAIPLAVVVYFAVKFAIGRMGGADDQAT
jgi:Flp pilus assembly protein protease CpaA